LQLQEFSLRNLTVTTDQFHFLRVVFSSPLKSKVGNIIRKTVDLRVHLNIDVTPIVSRSHTHSSHSQTSRLLTSSFIFRCSSPPRNPVYVRRVDLSPLGFSLSSHRHSYISFLFSPRFIA
jgi:gluconate kinase